MGILQTIRRFFLEWFGIDGKHIVKYVKELDIENDLRDWMRGDIFNGPSYELSANDKKMSLEQFLFEMNRSSQNILIVTGEPHIGKASFIKQLLSRCKEMVVNSKGFLLTNSVNTPFRVPVCISYESFAQFKELLDLSQIIERIMFGSAHTCGQTVKKLLNKGRFVIYLEGKEWLSDPTEDLQKVLSMEKQMAERNQFILKARASIDIQQAFLSKQTYISFNLDKLTEAEVTQYLQTNHRDLLHIVDKNKNLMEILGHPEHLKMFGKFPEDDLLKQIGIEKIESDFDFYEIFLRVNILKKLNGSEGYREGSSSSQKKREEAVYSALKKHATHIFLGGAPCKNDPSQFFAFSDFCDVGILDEESHFVFPLCGYYLAAESLSEEIACKAVGGTFTIPKSLFEKPLEAVLILTARMLKEVESREALWKYLSEAPECKLLLLSKIAKGMNWKEFFYEKALDTFRLDFYDCTVLEAFNELGDEGVKYVQHRYYELGSEDNRINNNIRKRIVYFLGISHSGIIKSMLKELTQANTDTHLKYHIIRAAVENYGIHLDSTRFIEEGFNDLVSYCNSSEDPIIKSDFCVLYKKHMKDSWLAAHDMYALFEMLKDKLGDSVYWVRAHAAGAIGRHATLDTGKLIDAEGLLLNCVDQELARIYDEVGDFRNSIKVISYSVEALCELSDTNRGQDSSRVDVVGRLASFIDLNRLGNEDVEDAYATIATGIEYMANLDTGKLPFNLGGRFRNHSISYRKVLRNAFSAYMRLVADSGDLEREIKGKINRLDKILKAEEAPPVARDTVDGKGVIRVLQMSDWHYEGSNSENNLIIQAIKKEFCGKTDVLVITGDLRQYGKPYQPSLKILRDLTKGLKLEPEDVFMVPGNHDCEDYPERSKIFKEIRKHIDSDVEYYRNHMNDLLKGLEEYQAFLKEFYGEDLMVQGGISNSLNLWRNRLHILCVNTALLCDGNTSMSKLVDINQLTELEREDELPAICIAHHNLNQLYYKHAQTVRAVFDNLKISALLSGDIHQPDQQTIRQDDTDIPNYICGKLLGKTSDTWSSRIVVLLEIDEKEGEMVPHYYKWSGSRFEPDHMLDRRPKEGLQGKWEPERVPLRK